MRKLSKRQLWLIVVVLLVAVAVLSALRPTPVTVETGAVTRGPLRVTIDEEGATRVRSRYVVSAPITGRLARPAVDAGDLVAAGAVVARLTPAALDPRSRAEAEAAVSGAESALREARAAVEPARAAREQARRDAERARTLAAAGAIAARDVESATLRAREAESALTAAQARASQAAAAVTRARAALMPSAGGGAEVVRAPVGGRVLRVLEESERVVPAGTPLLQIGDPNDLEIVVDLRSDDAVRVRPGAPMLLDGWGGPEPLQASVRTVEPAAFTEVSALGVEEQRVNVIGGFAQSPPQLGDGYRVTVRIVVWESPSVLRVPTGALFRDGAGWAVFVVADGRATRRTVQVGQRASELAEVVDGLAEGELVVLHPSDRIGDGVRVTGDG